MNILICSAGRRVKLVKYFKQELEAVGGKIIAADCDPTAPALHFADSGEIVPRIDDPGYFDEIMKLCKKYQIRAIFSLIDPELTFLANHKDKFDRENIKVVVSDKEVVNVCFDKLLTYKFLQENSIPAVPVFKDINEILLAIENKKLGFPLIVKPRKGSASMGITTANSMNELKNLLSKSDDLIIQPYMEGQEFGVDCYIDLITKEATNIFCKRKINMRAGETDKSEAVKIEGLIVLIEKLVKVLKPVGPIDIDCFKTKSGYVISEINPRFGGGYPHAHETGQNFVKNIFKNLQGIPNSSQVGRYPEGTIMIKYDEVKLLKLPISNVEEKERVTYN